MCYYDVIIRNLETFLFLFVYFSRGIYAHVIFILHSKLFYFRNWPFLFGSRCRRTCIRPCFGSKYDYWSDINHIYVRHSSSLLYQSVLLDHSFIRLSSSQWFTICLPARQWFIFIHPRKQTLILLALRKM